MIKGPLMAGCIEGGTTDTERAPWPGLSDRHGLVPNLA